MRGSRATRNWGNKPRGARAGFTLLESLVALVLTGLVTAGVAMALRTGLDASERARERAAAHAEARAAFEILAADLGSAYLSGVNTEETLFRAEPVEAVRPGEPFLSLTTLSYRRNRGPRDVGIEPRSDAVRVEYALQPADEEPGRMVLVRRERWLTETGPGLAEVVCEGVSDLRLRYSDGGEMEPGWSADAQENLPLTVTPDEEAGLAPLTRKLPRMVEITLLLSAGGDAENVPQRVYRTVVHVRSDGVAPFETEVVPPADEGSGGGGAGGSEESGGAAP